MARTFVQNLSIIFLGMTSAVHGEAEAEVCTTNKLLEGAKQWIGHCKTLQQCKDACQGHSDNCTFQWWTVKGACRIFPDGTSVENTTTWRKTANIVGKKNCDSASINAVGPTDCTKCPNECVNTTTTTTTNASTTECHTAVHGEECYDHVRWAMDQGIHERPEWYPPELTASSSFADFQDFINSLGLHTCPKPCATECHNAVEGEECYDHVRWAMDYGILNHPEWYPGLTKSSSFVDFQASFNRTGQHRTCPKPCVASDSCHTAVKEEDCYGHVVWAMATGISQYPQWYPGLSDESTFVEFQKSLHLRGHGFGTCPLPCEVDSESIDPVVKSTTPAPPASTCTFETKVGTKTSLGSHQSNHEAFESLDGEYLITATKDHFSSNPDKYPAVNLSDLSSVTEKLYKCKVLGTGGWGVYRADCCTCGADSPLTATREKMFNTPAQKGLMYKCYYDCVEWSCAGTAAPGNASSGSSCYTAVAGDVCYTHVRWAMDFGIRHFAYWYPGMTSNSSFEEFQAHMHNIGHGQCGQPCPATDATSTTFTTTKASLDVCRTVDETDECHGHVLWAKGVGIYQFPDWYPGLSQDSSFEDFQASLHERGHGFGTCPQPCAPTEQSTTNGNQDGGRRLYASSPGAYKSAPTPGAVAEITISVPVYVNTSAEVDVETLRAVGQRLLGLTKSERDLVHVAWNGAILSFIVSVPAERAVSLRVAAAGNVTETFQSSKLAKYLITPTPGETVQSYLVLSDVPHKVVAVKASTLPAEESSTTVPSMLRGSTTTPKEEHEGEISGASGSHSSVSLKLAIISAAFALYAASS